MMMLTTPKPTTFWVSQRRDTLSMHFQAFIHMDR